jgi:starvation-inducible outer membrane lipoprotein
MRSRLSSVLLVVLMVLVAAGTLGLVGCSSSTDSSSSPSAPSSTVTTAIDLYPWSEARAHMGEAATFTGPVVATIYEKALENTYAGKTIRVTGKVIEYQQAPGIEISSPDAIEVLD